MLEFSDWLPVPVAEDFLEYGIVGNSKTSALVSICDMDDFYCVSQDGDILRLKELQHDKLIGPALYSQNCVSAAVEWFDFSINVTVEMLVGLNKNT